MADELVRPGIQLASGRDVWKIQHELGKEWPGHRLLFMIIAGYAVSAYVLCLAVGSRAYLAAWQHVGLWVPLVFAIPLVIAAAALARGLMEAPRRPFAAAWRIASAWRPMSLMMGFALALSVGVFYASFVSVKNTLPLIVPFYADISLARLDAALHGGVDPWRLLEPFFRPWPGPQLIEFAYGYLWATFLIYVPTFVAIHPAFRAIRTRFFLTFFASWIGLGNVAALLAMSGGPVYYGNLTGDMDRFRELARFTADNHLFTGWVQQYLWHNYSTGQVELATGISAFPSMHVALATLYVVTARHFGVLVTVFFGAFALLILVGSVLLGWHYALDGYVSALFVILVWAWTGSLLRKSSRTPLHPRRADSVAPGPM